NWRKGLRPGQHSELEREADVQAVGPEVRPLEAEARPRRADGVGGDRSAERRALGRVHGPVDLLAGPRDVARVEERVADEDRGPARQPVAQVDGRLRHHGEDVARVGADVGRLREVAPGYVTTVGVNWFVTSEPAMSIVSCMTPSATFTPASVTKGP